MHNNTFSELANLLHKAIKQSFSETKLTVKDIYDQIGKPPNPKMGHFAFPCFPLAKSFKMPPAAIAQKIAENIEKNRLLESYQAQGPYLNVFVSSLFLGENVLLDVLEGGYFQKTIFEKAPKTMIEFSQPNTHKELHVGHMRNLCLGNAIVLLHQYCNHETIPVTYPGDSGTQLAQRKFRE